MNFCEQVSKIRFFGKRGMYLPQYHWTVIDEAISQGLIKDPQEYFTKMFLRSRQSDGFKYWK